MKRIERIIAKGLKNAKTSQGKARIENIVLCEQGYAEPGYANPKSGVIAFGDWNSISKWTGRKFVVQDESPSIVGGLLEEAGVELEWSDEWTFCTDCGKAVRTKPDSYGWKRSYIDNEFDEPVCGACVRKDPGAYLESLEGRSDACLTIDLDPTEHGYELVDDGFKNGLYGGQDADPALIGEALLEQGIERFLFALDAVRQFDIEFAVYVHESEAGNLDWQRYAAANKSGSDPAVRLRESLADATRKMDALPDVAGHAKVASCDLTTGMATVRSISPEDFIEGRALNR